MRRIDSRPRRFVVVHAFALACCVTIASCGFPSEKSAEPISAGELPAGLRTDDTVPPTTPQATERVSIWFVQEQHLVEVRHSVSSPATIESIIAVLLAGPALAEQESGIRSALPDATVLDSVTLARGTATAVLSRSFADIPAGDQLLAVGQLVLTLTDFRGVGSVQFVVGGTPIAVPLPTGETSDQPVFREQYIALRDVMPTS